MAEEIKDQEVTETPEAAGAAGATEASEGAHAAKKFKLKRWQATLGIIVIVIIVVGVAFGVWHNTPSFCGVCHSPMGNYVSGYENDSTQLAYQMGHITGKAKDTLKSGVSDSNKACLDCHEATLHDQIAEANSWVFGAYTVDKQGNVISADAPTGNKAFCTRCHDYEKVVEATEGIWGEDEAGNPHASHQGDLDCTTCHSPHGTSTLYCSSCHNFEVPEGWQTVAEAQAKQGVVAGQGVS